MRIPWPVPRQEDDTLFVRLRGFPDEASREPLEAAFHHGAEWPNGFETEVVPMLDNCSAVVGRDTGGLRSRRPAETASRAVGG